MFAQSIYIHIINGNVKNYSPLENPSHILQIKSQNVRDFSSLILC